MSRHDDRFGVAFVGSARYTQPLDPTSEKKFALLGRIVSAHVVAFAEDGRWHQFEQHATFYLLPKLPVAVLRYGEVFVAGTLVALWLALRRRVEVLVAQGPHEGLAAALAKTIAGWCGRRVALVVESHGDFEVSVFMQRRVRFASLFAWLMDRVARFTLRRADVLRAVSGSTRAQLARWSPGRPCREFPTWTDFDAFLAVGRARQAGPARDILCAAMLVPRKGIHHLVEAFRMVAIDFPDSRLIVAGRPENQAYADQLRDRVNGTGLGSRVRFVGEVPQSELARLMGEARVFVLPSYSEGLPRVVLEAMAASLPVVATAVSGVPQVVTDGVTGRLVPPGDEGALADALRWVLGHEAESREMASRARAVVERLISTERYLDEYRALLMDARQTLNVGAA